MKELDRVVQKSQFQFGPQDRVVRLVVGDNGIPFPEQLIGGTWCNVPTPSNVYYLAMFAARIAAGLATPEASP